MARATSDNLQNGNAMARGAAAPQASRNSPATDILAVAQATPDAPASAVDELIDESKVVHIFTAAAGGRIELPEGSTFDQIIKAGSDLYLVQSDGSLIKIVNGAALETTLVAGGIEIPPEALAAALEGAEDGVPTAGPETGGPPQSSGNTFNDPTGELGGGLNFGGLLQATGLDRRAPQAGPDAEEIDGLPTAGFVAVEIDEDALPFGIEGGLGDIGPGVPSQLSGTLIFDFGPNGHGGPNGIGGIDFYGLNGRAAFDTAGARVTSDGTPITYTYSGTTLTAQAGSETVFTILLDPLSGRFTLTFFQSLDHPVSGEEDDILLRLPYRVRDADGDETFGTLQITVDDDSPVVGIFDGEEGIGPEGAILDEDDLLAGNRDMAAGDDDRLSFESGGVAAAVGGSLGVNWGADDGDNEAIIAGPGNRSVAFTDTANASANVTLIDSAGNTVALAELSSGGDPVNFHLIDGQTLVAYTGSVPPASVTDPGVVFHVTLSDDGAGSYLFTLVAKLDHPLQDDPNGGGADGSFEDNLNFDFAFTATDSDGDSAQGTFTVSVDDDSPAVTGDPIRGHVDESALADTPAESQTLTFDNPDDPGGPDFTVTHDTSTIVGAPPAGVLFAESDPIVINANDDGRPFILNSMNISGVFSTAVIALNGYDAAGALVATHSFIASRANTNFPLGFFSAAGTPFETALVDRLELSISGPTLFPVSVDNVSVTFPAMPGVAPVDVQDLSALVGDGADADATFALQTFDAQNFGAMTALGGQQLKIVSDGQTLRGFVDNGSASGAFDGGDTVIFTLTVSPQGEAVFTLLEGIDQNLGPSTGIDFGPFIDVTDTDGDTISLNPGDYVVSVEAPVTGQPPVANDDPDIVGEAVQISASILATIPSGESVTTAVDNTAVEAPITGIDINSGEITFTAQSSGFVSTFIARLDGVSFNFDQVTFSSGDFVPTIDVSNGVLTLQASGVFFTQGATMFTLSYTTDATLDVDANATTGNLHDLLLTNDFDPDGDPIDIVAIDTTGTTGTVLFDDATNMLTYTADGFSLAPGEVVYDTFTYTLTDRNGGLDIATVTFTVTGQNTPAIIAGDDMGTVVEDTILTDSGTLTIVDPNPGEAMFIAHTGLAGTYGTLDIDENGNWTYTLDNDLAAVQNLNTSETLTDQITVQSADGATHQIGITIEGVDDNVMADNAAVDEDGLQNASADGSPDLRPGETPGTENAMFTGSIVAWFGAASEIPANPLDAIMLLTGGLDGQLTRSSDNEPVELSVSPDGRTLTGRANGEDVITIEITGFSQNGPEVTYDYQITLHQAVGHGVARQEDSIFLNGVTVEVMQANSGQLMTDSFDVEIIDDIPVARDDRDTVVEGGNSTSGNVITGADPDSDPNMLQADSVGADAPPSISQVVHGGITYTLANADGDGLLTITTALGGTLRIQLTGPNAGDHTYSSPASVMPAPTTFTVSVGNVDPNLVEITAFDPTPSDPMNPGELLAIPNGSDNFGFGIGSPGPNGGEDDDGDGKGNGDSRFDEINYTEAGTSETLVFTLQNGLVATQANVELSWLFTGEAEVGDEQGQWQAFRNGQLVGEDVFQAVSASGDVSIVVQLNGQAFDELRFIALPGTNQQNPDPFDSSDYYVQQIEFVAEKPATETFEYTLEDADGDTGAATLTVEVEDDTTPPTVTVDIVDTGLDFNDNSSLVTFEFSETVTDFEVSDITTTNGTLTHFTQVDGDSYTAIFTADPDFTGTGTVSVADGSYTDLAGNPGGPESGTVNIDTPPFVSGQKPVISLSFDNDEPFANLSGLQRPQEGDVVRWDGATASILFRGEDHFQADPFLNISQIQDIDGFHLFTGSGTVLGQLFEAGDMLLSTEDDAALPGTSGNLLTFEGEDVVFWDASEQQATLLFDGSRDFADFGFGGSNVDAVSVIETSPGSDVFNLVLSADDTVTLPGSTPGTGTGFLDGDLFTWNGTGAARYFLGFTGFSGRLDGRDGFGEAGLDAVHVLGPNEMIFSTDREATISGVTFQDGDLVYLDDTTATVILRESDFGANWNIDAVDPPKEILDALLANVVRQAPITATRQLEASVSGNQFVFAFVAAAFALESIVSIAIDIPPAQATAIDPAGVSVSYGADAPLEGVPAAISEDGNTLTITLPEGAVREGGELTIDIATVGGDRIDPDGMTFSAVFTDGSSLEGTFEPEASSEGPEPEVYAASAEAEVEVGKTITGTDNDDVLIGGDGDDVIIGGGGDDILDGGAGRNTLTGGDGADTFVLSHIDIADIITDYNHEEGDQIDLSALLGESGAGDDGTDIGDFVRVVSQESGEASLEVDTAGGGNDFTKIATLQGLAAGDMVKVMLSDDGAGAVSGDIMV